MPSSISETGVVFFSAGGHSHDGLDSSLIDTSAYSIYDFSLKDTYTTRTREKIQQKNKQALKDFIVSTVNTSVLQPSGIVLQDNIINSRNIIAGSITSEEIAANTITANNIAASTITGDLIAAGTITADLLDANAIVSNSITIGANDYWASNGYFRLGGTDGISYNSTGTINIGSSVYISGDISGASGTFSGAIQSDSGRIGGWDIYPGFPNLNIPPYINAGKTTLYSNGLVITGEIRTLASDLSGAIVLGADVGSGQEIHFYKSGSTKVKNTLRTSTSNNAFVISTIDGIAFSFSSGLSTAGSISGSSFSTSGNITGGNISASLISSTNQFRATLGTNSSPSYSFASDSDTGIRRGGTGSIVLIGDGSPIATFTPTATTLSVDTIGTLTPLYISTSGGLTKGSSRRDLKNSIEPLENSLDLIKKIEPIKFYWNSDFTKDELNDLENSSKKMRWKNYGFIAEQVAEVDENLAVWEPIIDKNSSEEEIDMATKDISSWKPTVWKDQAIAAITVGAIQELAERVEALENIIKET